MTWWCTSAGTLLVLVVLRDVFHTLWHPKGFGALARLTFRAVWRAHKPLNRDGRSTELAGPAGLLLTVLLWAALLVLGFALVYWPRMPQDFHYGTSLDPARSSDLLGAAYLSLVALATLGLGDIMPASQLLRIVVPLQALTGFVLLTAAISWVLQLYPALARRRSLALRLDALAASGAVPVVRSGEPSIASALLDEVATGVASVEVDLVQYGESYFFRDERRHHSLAAQTGLLLELVGAGGDHRAAEVRQAAGALGVLVDRLARTLDREFLSSGQGTAGVLEAYRNDHQHH